MKKNRFITILFTIFLIIGLIITIPGIILCLNTFDYKNTKDTVGKISKIENNYKNGNSDIYVIYKDENENIYESKLDKHTDTFYVGDEIEVYYDIDNPEKIGSKKLDLLVLIMPGIGIIFTTIGGIGVLIIINKKRKEQYLITHGKKITATYTETKVNTMVSINGQYPFNIICEWKNPVDNKTYLFKSKNIWFNPDKVMADKDITTFPVYLNEKKPRQYVVDIDSLTADIIDLT